MKHPQSSKTLRDKKEKEIVFAYTDDGHYYIDEKPVTQKEWLDKKWTIDKHLSSCTCGSCVFHTSPETGPTGATAPKKEINKAELLGKQRERGVTHSPDGSAIKITAGYGGEVGIMYQVSYAAVKRGDKTYCAWCDKDLEKIKGFKDHAKAHEFSVKQAREELVKEMIKKLKSMKNPNDYSTSCICDQCGNERTNKTLDDVISKLTEYKKDNK